MIPYEVVGFGAVVLIMPRAGFVVAAVGAVLALWAAYFVFGALVAIARQIPTAIGYSDLAANTTKKVAVKTATAAQTAAVTANPKIAV
jgi:hypothetical protein